VSSRRCTARHSGDPKERRPVTGGRQADDPAPLDNVPGEQGDEEEREVGVHVDQADAEHVARAGSDPDEAADEDGEQEADENGERDSLLGQSRPAPQRVVHDRSLREEQEDDPVRADGVEPEDNPERIARPQKPDEASDELRDEEDEESDVRPREAHPASRSHLVPTVARKLGKPP
jgi:hypothetical protein